MRRFCAVTMLILSALFVSCDFFADGNLDKKDDEAEITAIRLSDSSVTLQAGGVAYIAYSVNPSGTIIEPTWSYDTDILEVTPQSSGAVLKGKKEGETSLTVAYKNRSATAIVKVSGFAETYLDTTEPYIYSNTQVINMEPGDTEQVSVSLYNGTAADIDGYSWTIDTPSTATLQPTGQYCKIKAESTGYARIKVTHTKSSEPYYIGVYVFDDLTKATYITTKYNLSTLHTKDGDKTISVDLKNPKSESYKSLFTWEITDGSEYVSVTPNGNECIVSPLKTGVSTVRIKHPQSSYPLEIKIRVVEIVENVYIEPNETQVNLSGTGENTKTLTMALNGIKTGEYSDDEFVYEVLQDDEVINYSSFSNQIVVTGVHNGAAQIYVSHPCSQKKRQIIVICENQIADAVDASITINTTQDFIKTKVGAEETNLRITLEGGKDGDENRFKWSVKQNPENGSSDVIEVQTVNGTVDGARMAGASYVFANCYIKPVSEGTATITISHPKSYYTREILVKVLGKDAVLEQQYYFSAAGILKFLNSETVDYSVRLVGAKESEKSGIKWQTESSTLNINANGEQAQISSSATGSTVGNITVSHPKASSPKDVLVLTADTEEELESIKAFYSDKTYYSVNVGKSTGIIVNSVGFDTYNEETDETESFDFTSVKSQIVWESSDYNVCSVEKKNENPLYGTITGVKAGTAKITVKYLDTKAEFNVTVYPENVEIGEIEKSVYLSAYNNVVILSKPGEYKDFSVTPVGLDASKYSGITWKVSDEDTATVVPNGEKATITALKEGETTITVSHPESENNLKVNVRIGSEYVTETVNPVVSIATNTELIAVVKDSGNYTLSASLVNAGDSENLSGFSFAIDDSSVAQITASYPNGKAYIKPVSPGQAEITVTHEKAKYPKKVLVLVANTAEELAGYKYLTTDQNVVNIGEGNSRSISVTMENSAEIYLDGYTWKSENPEIASIVSTTAGTAVVKGNTIGVTRILVSHNACSFKNPLEIIVQVIDPVAAAACPWITASPSIINLVEDGGWQSLKAILEGGTEDDEKDFVWTTSDPDIVNLYGQNGTARVKAKKEGSAIIKISHPKAIYPAQIRCICDSKASTEYSISVSGGNILSLKPDGGDTSITATLVNGGTTDKYNFNWSLDVYDVVDLTYSANTAIITPLKEGSATLTVSHPKSAYDQQIKIKVQQYDTFGFSGDSKKITEGTTSFISMQLPASSVETYVSYRSSNEKICKISGTKAVCELTGTGSGSTVVYADLIAKKTDSVLSTAEMLVYVEKAAESLTYITSGDGGISSTFTMTKGTNKILSAELVGEDVKITDQPNLTWTSSNPLVVKINGTDTTGKATGASVYVEAVESGECTITVSHPKSNTDMVFRIIVPGVDEASVSLNKSFVTIEKGKTTEIKATIEGGTNKDYKSLSWSIDKVNGTEIATVMGSGQTVTVYALQAGTCNLRCALSNGEYAECTIKVEATKQLSFDRQVLSLEPGHSKSFVYKISPADATIEWVYSGAVDGSDYIVINDISPEEREIEGGIGKGTVTIEGIKEGNVNLNAVSSYGNKAAIQIRCEWNYEFNIESAILMNMNEEEEYHLEYSVSPADAEFEFSGAAMQNLETYSENSKVKLKNISTGSGKGYFVIKPETEITAQELYIKARNPNLNTGSTKGDFVGDKTISVNCYYKNLTLKTAVESDGKFSKVQKAQNSANDVIYMGDGETAKLLFSFAEAKTSAKVTRAEFKWEGTSAAQYGENQTAANMVSAVKTDGTTGKYTTTLQKLCADKLEYLYKITELYEPCYNGNVIVNWDSENSKDFVWYVYNREVSSGSRDYFFTLQYIPLGGRRDVICRSTIEATTYKYIVFLFHDDRDINGVQSQCIVNCPVDAEGQYGDAWLNTYGGWSKKYRSYENNPIYMTQKSFEENPWLFCPGTIYFDGACCLWDSDRQCIRNEEGIEKIHSSFKGIHICPHVLKENVKAEKIISFKENANNVGTVGILDVYYSHLGNETKVQIPVMLEIRQCEKNLKTSK